MSVLSKKFLCLLFVCCISPAAFADIPDPNADEELSGSDAEPAPIDASLAVLLAAGIGLACYQLRRKAVEE